MFKKERGITLVALVVTIVVLLILAGVSISMVLGNNGIVTKAKETQTAQDKAYAEDVIESGLKAVQIEVLSNTLPTGKTANVAYVVEKIDDPDFKVKSDSTDTITYTKGTSTYDIKVDMTKYIVDKTAK
jgi:type II secretory pathway pseudopilin PulG